MKTWVLGVAIMVLGSVAARADMILPTRFKSPGGHFIVSFASSTAKVTYSFRRPTPPRGQSLQYLLFFYMVGSSDPISFDWYTDADPPKSPTDIEPTFLWSPQEDYVIVTHGQNAQQSGPIRWAISLDHPLGYGFEGDHLQWIDRYRLVADINTTKIPGGIELVDAKVQHSELLVSPHIGIGYQIAGVTGHRVIVKEFLNHWDDDKEKTSWEFFDPACFTLDLDSMKKRSVPCPKS